MTQPGYPLPSGELGSDDIVCQLVYLPDRPEYWQALIGALSYMATWRAWERDDDKRGKDAAENWRNALELTMECWRMACLEQLQDDVAEILAIMQLGQSCCDEQDITNGDQYTDRVEDGVGDVPQNIIDAGYATGVSDWAGFDDYKCMISHVTVNQITARLDEFAAIVNQYGAVAGGLAAVAGILAVIFGTGGLAIVFGMVAGVGAVSLLYEALMDFPSIENLSTKVSNNHDELACAIYEADGDVGALVALNDKIDELFSGIEAVILKNMNLGPTLKNLYAGRYDQQDTAEILVNAGYELDDFSCNCEELEEGQLLLNHSWVYGEDNWTVGVAWDLLATLDWNGVTGYGVFWDAEKNYPIDFPNLVSDDFEIPAGVTQINAQIRCGGKTSRDGTWYVRIRRASDHAIISTQYEVFGHGPDWAIKSFPAVSVTAGLSYYVQIKLDAEDGYAQAIDWVKVWEA